MEDLYQEIILDHYRAPKNRAPELEGEDVCVHHNNPLCGDEMDLRIAVTDGKLAGIAFDGEGCSISQASASAMTVAVVGRELADATDLADAFREMMAGDEPARIDDLLDGVAFQGVAKFPVRVKCALLGWMALKDAIQRFELGESSSSVTHGE